jgi:hypothetical protein
MVDNWQDDDLLRTQFDKDMMGRINFIDSGRNCRTAARYAILEKVENEVIATVDDDYVVTPSGWDNILNEWTGDRIVAQVPSDNMQLKNAYKVPFLNIGYGSLFKREWADAVFPYLFDSDTITSTDWEMFGDRIFTTFVGFWKVIEATDSSLTKLRNYDGSFSETDGSAIHLKEGYWLNQWALVLRVMLKRVTAREHFLSGSHSLSGYRDQMEFLSHTGCGEYLPGNG